MMKISNKNLLIIFLLLGVAINIVLYSKINQSVKQLIGARSQLLGLKQKELDLIELEKDFSRLDESVKEIKKTFPKDTKDVTVFLETMVKVASISGVQVEFNLDDQILQSKKGTAKELIIRMSIYGDYSSIINYLNKTYLLPYYFDIKELDIKNRLNGNLECAVKIYLSVL